MTATSELLLRDDELVVRDGIHHRRGDETVSDYRRRWEDEAAEDHVRSAIAAGETKELDYAALTGKIAPVWDEIPAGQTSAPSSRSAPATGESLSTSRGSATSRGRPTARSTSPRRCFAGSPSTASASPGQLDRSTSSAPPPISCRCEDESVDTVLTSVVFLHMGKSFVARAVAEIARVLRPGGQIVFDASFPNARNPANLLLQAKPKRLRSPNYMKFWTRGEVESLLESSGLTAKTGRSRSSPSPTRSCRAASARCTCPAPAG